MGTFHNHDRRGGLVLLAVIGILLVLSVLGVAFTTMARLERRASQQRLAMTRACLLARSGLEDAQARLAARQDPDASQDRYGGRLAPDASYALKVVPQEGIFVNGGDPGDATLRRMLGLLAKAVGLPALEEDGWALVDLRPGTPRGWESWAQVRDLALGGSQAKLEALQPYLSLQAFVDRKVIRPNALESMENAPFSTWADLKTGSFPVYENYLNEDGEPDVRLVGTVSGGRGPLALEARAPVRLAWARTRRPVLLALLGGLKGLWLDESSMSCVDYGDRIGTLRAAALSEDDSRTLADQILASTSELGSWQDWEAFCDGLAVGGASAEERQAKRDLLKANFNPNSDLNKCNPNASRWRSVDKSDLLAHSTEFSLLPSVNPVALESTGRVSAPDGRLLARAVLRATVAGPTPIRLTTQKELVCEDLGALETAGDEQVFRLPGQGGGPFLPASSGTSKSWGHALGAGDGRGVGLQSYPEPCVDPGGGLEIHPSDVDGNLQLATLETEDDASYGVLSAPRDMKLLARYTTGLDLALADAARPNQTDADQVSTAELGKSVLDPLKPNTLYPDGAYSERGRALSYLDKGNANGLWGLLSFWIKPNHQDSIWGFSRGHPCLKWTNITSPDAGGSSPNQFFYLGDDNRGPANTPFLCQFEVGHQSSDSAGNRSAEHRFETGMRRNTPHRWYLVTMFWNFAAALKSDTGTLLLDAGLTAGDQGLSDVYGQYSGNAVASASDITADDLLGPHRVTLGCGHPEYENMQNYDAGSGADATFDEFAIWDFGPSKACAAPLASRRFAEGRYAKGSAYAGLGNPAPPDRAGEWFSAPLRFGKPVRILGLAWSQAVPKGLRAPLDPGPDGAVRWELADLPGTGYARDASRRALDRRLGNDAWSPLETVLDAPFRLHALFQPNLADPANTPILDPLTLDDVTLLCEGLGGARLLAWGRGE